MKTSPRSQSCVCCSDILQYKIFCRSSVCLLQVVKYCRSLSAVKSNPELKYMLLQSSAESLRSLFVNRKMTV